MFDFGLGVMANINRIIREGGKDYLSDREFMQRTAIGEVGHEEGYNWSRIPLVPFRANRYETPLIKGAKSLQDAINTILSNFSDNMQEDTRNTILEILKKAIIENYISEA